MGWTQEMQSHCFAFQASSLRFGLQCWWFCGLGLIGQLELQRRLGSAMWDFCRLSFGAEMSTSLLLLCLSPSHVGCTLYRLSLWPTHTSLTYCSFLSGDSFWLIMQNCPIACLFLKYTYLFSCQELDETITLHSKHETPPSSQLA